MGTNVTIGGWSVGSSSIYCNAQGGAYGIELGRVNVIAKDSSGTPVQSSSWSGIIKAGANASDKNLKKDIEKISINYDKIFDELLPITFKYKNDPIEQTHIGFIAQDIINSFENNGVSNFDGIWKDQGYYQLNKQEFIALNTWQIQKLKSRVSELEQKVEALEKIVLKEE